MFWWPANGPRTSLLTVSSLGTSISLWCYYIITCGGGRTEGMFDVFGVGFDFARGGDGLVGKASHGIMVGAEHLPN